MNIRDAAARFMNDRRVSDLFSRLWTDLISRDECPFIIGSPLSRYIRSPAPSRLSDSGLLSRSGTPNVMRLSRDEESEPRRAFSTSVLSRGLGSFSNLHSSFRSFRTEQLFEFLTLVGFAEKGQCHGIMISVCYSTNQIPSLTFHPQNDFSFSLKPQLGRKIGSLVQIIVTLNQPLGQRRFPNCGRLAKKDPAATSLPNFCDRYVRSTQFPKPRLRQSQ